MGYCLSDVSFAGESGYTMQLRNDKNPTKKIRITTTSTINSKDTWNSKQILCSGIHISNSMADSETGYCILRFFLTLTWVSKCIKDSDLHFLSAAFIGGYSLEGRYASRLQATDPRERHLQLAAISTNIRVMGKEVSEICVCRVLCKSEDSYHEVAVVVPCVSLRSNAGGWTSSA